MTKALFRARHLIVCLLRVLKSQFIHITAWNLGTVKQAGRHNGGTVAKS